MEAKNLADNTISKKIHEGRSTGATVEAKLSTHERVLARVTDGIYRQPSSALRELIANAYDADATKVTILTDAPRFEKIIVRDNGRGLTPEILEYVIQSIGGSAKRTVEGEKLGVTDANDPMRSPSGRFLIGKIGIGLFSVAQLTNHFQIITKVKGDSYRTIADITLRTYSEDQLAQVAGKGEFQTGSVKIWSVFAEDVDAQGTEIVLTNIRRAAKEALQSRERWLSVISNEQRLLEGDVPELDVEPPIYHIGGHSLESGKISSVPKRLPWDETDEPDVKFKKLVDATVQSLSVRSKPKLDVAFDNYLHAIWALSLAAPLDYIDGHPFSLTSDETGGVYLLSNEPKGQAELLKLEPSLPVRDAVGLSAGKDKGSLPFSVFIDGIKLSRPIKFKDLPEASHALKQPLFMVGKCRPDLSAVPEEYRGGNLEFEAYLFWTPKVIPRDHAGALIRIHEASGTLFDETFLKYQVSEAVRLKQITAEIFVREGLDGALNIDRESFNFAHPHYQYIQKWVHGAFRQLASRQKSLAKQVRDLERESRVEVHKTAIQTTVDEEWARARGEEEKPPEIVFEEGLLSFAKVQTGLIFNRERVFPRKAGNRKAVTAPDEKKLEEKIKAVAAVLMAYGVFDDMSEDKQHELLTGR